MSCLSKAADEYGKDTGWIFPSKMRKPLSDNTISKLLRENGVQAVPLGSDPRSETGPPRYDYAKDIAEAALAHTVGNKVEAAYKRTKFLDRRREMMADWGKFCKGKK